MTLSSITLNWSPLYFVWWWPGAKFKINISSDHHWNFPISSNFLLKIYHGSLRKWIAMKTYVASLSCVVKQPRCWRIDITECTSWIRSQVVSLKINCCCAVGSLNLKVLLQWNSTSVYTSCTYSTYHLELALGIFICHFISACLVCHTS